MLLFGIAGAPTTFHKAMNDTLMPLLRKCVLVFFDNILVYTLSLEQHQIDLDKTLQLLQQQYWQIKTSTCSFAKRLLDYLGHVINKGVATLSYKISDIKNCEVSSNVKELRSFRSLAGYYRKFVREYGIISRPLTDRLR